MNNKDAVRFPVTCNKTVRASCLYALWEGEKLGYIDARKKIYKKVYTDLVNKTNKFEKLKQMLQNGINLLIVEVDGPRQEPLEYYKEKYKVSDDFIVNNTIEVNSKIWILF